MASFLLLFTILFLSFSQAALPYMRKRGFGRIVNIASIAGKEGNAGECPYYYYVVVILVDTPPLFAIWIASLMFSVTFGMQVCLPTRLVKQQS